MQSLDALTKRLRKDQSTWHHDRERSDYLLIELLGELAYTRMQPGFVPPPPPQPPQQAPPAPQQVPPPAPPQAPPPPQAPFANRPVPPPAPARRGFAGFNQAEIDAIARAVQAEQAARQLIQDAARQHDAARGEQQREAMRAVAKKAREQELRPARGADEPAPNRAGGVPARDANVQQAMRDARAWA